MKCHVREMSRGNTKTPICPFLHYSKIPCNDPPMTQ